MRRVFYILVLLLGVLPVALAQTGTWSGEIEFRGMTIGMVFHFDGDEPTMDVPDQGAFGLPMQVERKDAAIEAMEGLNHLFQHSETGQPAEYRRLEETFSPEAIEKIIKWISALK